MSRCASCKRLMLPYQWFWLYSWTPLAYRVDCGGDCFRCVDELEGRLD